MASSDFLDTRLAKALSHPLRPRILRILQDKGEASPQEIATELGERLGNVSYHMRILKDQGCVELARTEPRRGAIEHYYRPLVRPYLDDEQWRQLPVVMRRQLAGQTLGDVMQGIADAARSGGFDPAGAHVIRTPLRLDEQGWAELSALVAETLQQVERLQAASDERGEPAASSELVVLHYAPGRDSRA